MSKSATSSQTASNSQDVAGSTDECLDDQEHEHESGHGSGVESDGNDDAPHRNPVHLEQTYERFGTIDDTATYFDVSTTTIRKYLRQYGLYTSEESGCPIRARDLNDMSPEDVGLPPIGER